MIILLYIFIYMYICIQVAQENYPQKEVSTCIIKDGFNNKMVIIAQRDSNLLIVLV